MTTPHTPSPEALQAGVFDILPAQCRELVEAARTADRCTRTIDACGVRDKHALLARIAHALDFPQWFGHNWDALADCLGDLSWLPPQSGYVFALLDCSDHTEAMPILREILEQASADWQARGITMTILIAPPEVRA